MSWINQSLNEEDELYVEECDTPKQTIDKLRALKVKENHEYNLNKQLMNLHWNKNESAEIFVNNLNRLRKEIKQTEKPNSDAR